MAGGALNLFRGADGRSLGRALAILYLVAAVVASFGNGASAAMATGVGTLCITTPDGTAPGQAPASGSDTPDCCLTGHSPTPAAAPVAPIELPVRIAVTATVPVPSASSLPTRRHIGAASPRGPPLDA